IDLWARTPAERDRYSHGLPELRPTFRAPHAPLQCEDGSAKHHEADDRKRDPHEPFGEVLRDRAAEGNHQPPAQCKRRTPPDPTLDVLTDAPTHEAHATARVSRKLRRASRFDDYHRERKNSITASWSCLPT